MIHIHAFYRADNSEMLHKFYEEAVAAGVIEASRNDAGNLKYDKADSEKNSRAERILKGRADYNDYLELLLHSVSENIKNYRTMTAMELRIIDMGRTGFRMKDYIYEARIQVNVLPKADRRINAKEYIRQVKYSYIS